MKWEKRKSDLNKRRESQLDLCFLWSTFINLETNLLKEWETPMLTYREETSEYICSAANLVLVASFRFP